MNDTSRSRLHAVRRGAAMSTRRPGGNGKRRPRRRAASRRRAAAPHPGRAGPARQRRRSEEGRRQEEAGAGRRAPPAREAAGAAHRQARAARPSSRSRRSSWRPTTAAAASSRASRRSSPAATPASAAPSPCCSRAKAPTSTVAYLDEHDDAEETKRCIEAEGRRCLLVAGDVKKREVRAEGRRQDDRGLRPARRPGQQRRLPGARRVDRGHHRRAPRGDLPHQHLRLLPHGAGGAAAPEGGRVDHQHRLGHGPEGQRRSCSTTRRPRARSTRSRSRSRRT